MKSALLSLLVPAFALATCSQHAEAADALLQYTFNKGSGLTAADSGTGASAEGTLLNGTGWTTDTPGGAGAALDTYDPSGAAVRYLTASDPDKLDGLSQFTLSIWINLKAAPNGNRRLMSKQASSAAFEGFSWNFANAGNTGARTASNFGMRLFVGGETTFAFDPVPTAALTPTMAVDADNKWAFLAVSYDGTQLLNNVNYYMGTPTTPVTLLATTTVAAGKTLPSSAAFGIGYTEAAPAANSSIPGLVDDARVYGSALSMSDINIVRSLNIPTTFIPGDADTDGDVDLDDQGIWATNFTGSLDPGAGSSTFFQGDFDNDNDVDLDDQGIWASHFTGSLAPSGIALIPEPAGLAGCGLALVALFRRRR